MSAGRCYDRFSKPEVRCSTQCHAAIMDPLPRGARGTVRCRGSPTDGYVPNCAVGLSEGIQNIPHRLQIPRRFFGVPELVLWKLQFVNPKFHKSSSGSRWPKYISNSLTTRSKK